MSGLFGSTTIKGTRLTDFPQTTATVGVVIPFGQGAFPCDGNIIFAPMPPKTHVTTKKQGKGGVKQETYSYTLSYAVAFCKGPIDGYLWIKRNGKVVWTQDPNAPIEDWDFANKWAQRATFYYGTKTQLPDSTIEAYEGTGQVSAFRNLAYIVLEDDVVEGGAVPTYEALCIVNGVGYWTTPPYAIEVMEETPPLVAVQIYAVKLQIEPSGIDYATAPVVINQLNLYGGSVSYIAAAEDFVSSAVNIDQLNLYGGAVSYVAAWEDSATSALVIDQLNLYGGAVTYVAPLDDIVLSSVTIDLLTLEDA